VSAPVLTLRWSLRDGTLPDETCDGVVRVVILDDDGGPYFAAVGEAFPWRGTSRVSAEMAARAAAATLAQPDTRDALRAEERGLAAAVSRLTAALEHAGDVPEIADRLRVQSERLREVRAELARAEAPRPTVAPADIDAAVADLRRDLEGDTAAARDVLGLLLLGRVRLTGGGRGRPVEIEAEAHVGRLVTSDAGGTSGALTGCGHTPCPGVVVLRAAA